MRAWQYRLTTHYADYGNPDQCRNPEAHLEKEMNKMGADGWEIVYAVPGSGHPTMSIKVLYKRKAK